MDELTERIFATLRHDGRASFSAMARALGTSRDIVAGRVHALMASGRLRIVAGIHPLAVGRPVSAHLAVRISGSAGPVLHGLLKFESLGFVSETTGAFQLTAETWLPSLQDLQTEVLAIRAVPGVVDVQIHLYEQVMTSFFSGRTPSGSVTLDRVDVGIMTALQRDGRAAFAEVADEVGLSVSGCRSRTMRLLDSGVLKIGAVNQRTDMTNEFLFGIGVNTTVDSGEAQGVLENDPGLEFMARCIGPFDLIATVGFGSLRRYNALVEQCGELPSVRHAETWLHVRIAREDYDRDLESIPLR